MHLSKYSFRVLCLGLCLGLVTSCAKREDADTTVTSDTTVTTNGSDTRMTGDSAHHNTTGNAMNGGTGVNVASFNDGNIIAFLGHSDSMEIAMGNMAKSKAQHADIKKFAQMMVTDHTKMKKEGEALAKKINVTPAMPAGDMMHSDMMAQHSALESASGHVFDSLYIGSQVAMHQHVLDNLNQLNPQNAEIRTQIDKAKPHIQKHLDEAKRIQQSFHAKH
jgi:putative membrane protein